MLTVNECDGAQQDDPSEPESSILKRLGTGASVGLPAGRLGSVLLAAVGSLLLASTALHTPSSDRAASGSGRGRRHDAGTVCHVTEHALDSAVLAVGCICTVSHTFYINGSVFIFIFIFILVVLVVVVVAVVVDVGDVIGG